MKALIPLALLLALSAETKAESSSLNAAVSYLRADVSLRQSYPLPPDAASTLEKALESPLDEEDEKLVVAAGEALAELRQADALKTCDWAVSSSDGPLANTAHRGAIRELVAVSAIRARLRFRERDSQGALDDILAAMAAARQLSLDGSLASVLIAYRLENAIAGVLARNLNLLSSSQLMNLPARLDALPSGSTLGNALEAETVNRNSLLIVADGAKTRGELIERLLTMAPYLGSDRALVSEIVDGCGGSVRGFIMCVEQRQTFCASWAARFTLPPEQFEKDYKSELGPLSKANPVIRIMTPNLAGLRWAEAYAQTRRALLRAAIAVQTDGPAALEQHPDPYDEKPFSYKPIERGFQLESRIKQEHKSLSLSVAPES